MALIKKVDLAHKLGVSKAYISKLIKDGKLKELDGLVDDKSIIELHDLKQQMLEAKLKNEELKGDLLRLAVKKKLSKYVPASKVRKNWEMKKKELIDAVLQIPTKLSKKLVGNEEQTIYKLLTDEIRTTLLGLCERK